MPDPGRPRVFVARRIPAAGLDRIVEACDTVVWPGELPPSREDVLARIAGTDEVREATGFDPGAVAPFPLEHVDAVFVERTLLSQPVLWVGAGSERHMAALVPTELLRLSRARPMDVVEQAQYHSP